jgi:hypothetical protein
MRSQPDSSTQVRQPPSDTPPRRRRRGVWLSGLALLLLIGSAVLPQPSRVGGMLRIGDQVVVPAGETWRGDLYASARVVRVAGRVDGDLVAVGGRVEIRGEVAGDVLAIGAVVAISGQVGGDARLVSGQLTVTGSVGEDLVEDLVAAGGYLHFTPSARVGGDLVFTGAQTTMDARVAGDMLGASGHYDQGGGAAGFEAVTTGGEEVGITFSERVRRGAVRVVSILGFAALLLWLFPTVVAGSIVTLRRRVPASFGIGLFGLVVATVLLLLLLLVMVGLGAALGLLGAEQVVSAILSAGIMIVAIVGYLLFVVTDFAATAVVGMCLGHLALRSERPGRRLAAVILGALAVGAVTAIPGVGCYLALLIVPVGLGALLLTLTGPPAERAAVA